MYLNFDEDTKKAQLKWTETEKGKPTITHQINREVYKIQYNPVHIYHVERVHFKGKAPGWIAKYAKTNKYIFEEVATANKEGWILIDNSEMKNEIKINSILIEKALRKLSDLIHPYFQKEKDQLGNNINTAIRNLKKRPNLLKDLGAYYAPERIYGIESSLWISYNILPKRAPYESEDDFQCTIESNVHIPELIQELIFEHPEDEFDDSLSEVTDITAEESDPEPDVLVTDIEEVEVPILLVSDRSEQTADPLNDEEVEVPQILISDQIIQVTTSLEDEEVEAPQILMSNQIVQEASILDNEEVKVTSPSLSEEDIQKKGFPSPTIATEEGHFSENPIPVTTNSSSGIVNKSIEYSDRKLIPSKIIHKKSGAYEGQLSFF
ncbi:hypothetical protein PTI45_03101 [Paenibacillus nuruki]|uniref:Uncharacterized protein n=1 Tax=Paenibacillus nuruki TaxID=1886670 RepID=A0A1E3L163_9BACL|nr:MULTISPECIES: hypothetical protein [Paenibacillus]ODP27539.1 hypothetical protein PTI45_03101 [Paenibacillus nuruki]TKJ87256.1 hypothetical protein PaeCFBP13512_18720 [Paenibacillus sp. CFBP13512]